MILAILNLLLWVIVVAILVLLIGWVIREAFGVTFSPRIRLLGVAGGAGFAPRLL